MKIKKIIIWFLVCVLVLNITMTVCAEDDTVQAGSITQSDNEKKIYDFLREELGLNTAAICGIMANIYSESKFLPTAYNPNDTGATQSYGICQWNSGTASGNRLGMMKNWCKSKGYSYKSLNGQLQYMKHELLTVSYYKYSVLLNDIEDTPEGAYEASKIWSKYYEGCALIYHESRATLAKDIFWPVYNENQDPMPIIAGANSPDSITAGGVFSIKGAIVAGSIITDVTVGCYDVTGQAVIENSAQPNARYYNIEKLDEGLAFNKLEPGIYTYKVIADNGEAEFVLVEKQFVVFAIDKTVDTGTYEKISSRDLNYSFTCYIEHTGSGYYMIKNVKDGLALSVEANNVVQREYTADDTQLWQILSSGNGGYYFVSKHDSGSCMTVTGKESENLILSPIDMSDGQIFNLNSTKYYSRTGNKVSFILNKGTVGIEKTSASITGYNAERSTNDLIVYNVSNFLVNTNKYGMEVAINSKGKVTKVRAYGDTTQLTVPKGGIVLSGHSESTEGGGVFVQQLKVGDYVYCDYENDKIYVYSTYNDYLAASKIVKTGNNYGDLPTPTRKNYLFLGWYTKASGGTKVTSETKYSSNKLYARWKYINLAAPKSVTLNLTGYNEVKVTWEEVKYADGYYVYYKRANAKTYSAYKTTTSTSMTLSNLKKENTKYDFKVIPYYLKDGKKIATNKYTENSITTLRNLKKPTDVTVCLTGHDDVKISWNKVSYAKGYYVYYKKSSNSTYKFFKTTKETAITISNLYDNTKYDFKVVPYGLSGTVKVKGDNYAESSIKTLRSLKKPESLTLKAVSKSKIKASWSEVPYAKGYYVYYKTANGSYKFFGRTTEESITITGLKSGTTYKIKVVPYGVRNNVRVKSINYAVNSIKTLK